jgi:cyclic beta-1,2-glucan synthetase
MAEQDPVKIGIVRITNTGSMPKRITVTSYVEWVLGVSRDLTQQYVRTTFDKETHALFGQNFFDQDYAQKVAFLAMSGTIESYSGDRREFIGRNGTPARPVALSKTMLSESVGETIDPCGALQTSVTIEPGAAQDIVVLLGAQDSPELVRKLINRYNAPEAANAEADRATTVWRDRISTIHVETPDAEFDRMTNGWVLYQALSCRMWGRTALYQSSGAYGFRDQLQDSMSFVYTDPQVAREHIIRSAHRQFVEGDVQHWWHPQTGRGVRTRISDDLVWLPFVVDHYIAVTGDESILDEQVPYIMMRQLEPHEHEIYDLPQESPEQGSIYDHCIRALRRACTHGVHGFPLIGGGDWNDGYNRVGIEGKGESVWLAWFLMSTLAKMADRAKQRGDMAVHDQFVEWISGYESAIEAHAWDGDWYIRAFFDDGAPLGSKTSDEAKIDSIAQSWSVIANRGTSAHRERAMQSLEQHLVRNDARLIMLLTPPFDKTTHDPGYIKGYLPGVRENGAQYTHAALWAVLATALQGRGTRAFELFQMLNPLTHTRDRAAVERYKVEPYVVVADLYTADQHLGRGGWTWYTGSASWMYRVALEGILGFTKRHDTLTLHPSIPAQWEQFVVTYRYQTATYTITVLNPEHVEHGVKMVTLDGAPVADGIVHLVDDGGTHQVVVTLGGNAGT